MSARIKLLPVILILAAVLSFRATVYGVPPDTTPPTIETPLVEPANPGPGDAATVSVVVTDARGIQNVSIVYTTDNWTASNVVLYASYNSTSGVAKATIPPQPGGRVSYYVVAYDTSSNKGVNNNAGAYFTYDIASGPATSITSLWGLVVIAVIGAAAGMILLGYLTRRKRTTTFNQNRGRRQPPTQTQP